MDFWKSVNGMVEVVLTSASIESILAQMNQKAVIIYDLQYLNELSCSFFIRRTEYPYVKTLCQQFGAQIEVKNKKGIFWSVSGFLRRPVLMTGFILFCIVVFLLPTRILFLKVEGNEKIPDRMILEAAEKSGIRFGASRREIRSEKVKNALIDAVPELQWVGVNTRGCVAVISVTERAEEPKRVENKGISSIVSNQDGYILSATATRGTLLVSPGQSVTKGQILISGISDLGIVTQATSAEGEVFAQTSRQILSVTPSNWYTNRSLPEEKKKISMLLGKKRINLWKDSGISGSSCGRMYEEYYITLPGDFKLPVGICVETITPYVRESCSSEEFTDTNKMEAYASEYLRNRMSAGQIRQNKTQWFNGNGIFLLQMQCICQEMIGIQRQEQIGDIYE